MEASLAKITRLRRKLSSASQVLSAAAAELVQLGSLALRIGASCAGHRRCAHSTPQQLASSKLSNPCPMPQTIRGLFGADSSQDEAVDKLEQLQVGSCWLRAASISY